MDIFQLTMKTAVLMSTLIHPDVCYCRMLHNTTNGIELLNLLGMGADNNIINAIDIANQSREAADQALKVT